jgi:hypothetical protein
MKKYLKIGVLLLCLLLVPSLVGAGCEGLDSSAQYLCQRLQAIETKQNQILQNQEKIKKALLLMSRGVHLYTESYEAIQKELK